MTMPQVNNNKQDAPPNRVILAERQGNLRISTSQFGCFHNHKPFTNASWFCLALHSVVH